MENITNLVKWVAANWLELAEAIAAIIGGASIIIRLTPTTKDDAMILPIIKFIGKWIALDKYSPKGEERPK